MTSIYESLDGNSSALRRYMKEQDRLDELYKLWIASDERADAEFEALGLIEKRRLEFFREEQERP